MGVPGTYIIRDCRLVPIHYQELRILFSGKTNEIGVYASIKGPPYVFLPRETHGVIGIPLTLDCNVKGNKTAHIYGKKFSQ